MTTDKLERARAEERERCAQIADEHARYWQDQRPDVLATSPLYDVFNARANEAKAIAAAIRKGSDD